ncbi:kinesin [Moesziomyces antarcticus T-34]|uniref:protein-tyrosine-phosphatase n=1 Tax=Pseudozyma antarctica (strain T-34) TaxID=1151754 RepID=M9LVZ8_PSEA3|nr:kinesin [Moesziomyces antarcticus T-34]
MQGTEAELCARGMDVRVGRGWNDGHVESAVALFSSELASGAFAAAAAAAAEEFEDECTFVASAASDAGGEKSADARLHARPPTPPRRYFASLCYINPSLHIPALRAIPRSCAIASFPDMDAFQADITPPPTPGPSSFAPPSPHAQRVARQPPTSLSLRIPQDGHSFGRLTQPSPLSARPPLSANHASSSTLAPPPLSRLARKRPSKLTLAPPSLADDPGLSSRSMPTSPVVLSRSNSKSEQQHDTPVIAPSAISEAVKHLSSTLRGTPRRRPSMPFKDTSAQRSAFPEPPSASSSRTRPPEAFRDPSEHILSGKGSTLQHARSVYSHGPVQILPGLYLGDEHNARDHHTLSALGITTILNVAKETTLDFSADATRAPPAQWSRLPERRGTVANGELPSARSHHASPQSSQVPPTPGAYFTPPTTASLPVARDNSDAPSPRTAISPSVLRNTSSTPNLLTQFLHDEPASTSGLSSHQHVAPVDASADLRTLTAQDVLEYRTLRRNSGSSSDDAFDTASSPSSSRAPSTCTSAATELTPPALMSIRAKGGDAESESHDAAYDSSAYSSQQVSPRYASDEGEQPSPSAWVTQVELPANATLTRVAVGAADGRAAEVRYIKLPWTHDETELASGHGGFAQGCALIAEALGVDARYWYAAKIPEDVDACSALHDDASLAQVQTSRTPGRILVHCQCGVSRSATLVIAFVMQAAAMRYGFEAARSLLGMHDCYNMVKDKSSSISPNISLIYQLVEWERYLSSAAGRLRDVLGMAHVRTHGEAGELKDAGHSTSLAGAGWCTETMDEAMWSKMRLEEEEKEAAEEARRRQERLNEAVRLAAERKAAQDRLEGLRPDAAAVGTDAAAGSLMQRRRKKAAPALQLQTAGAAATRGAVETPFQTARTEAWTRSEHDGDGDVMMDELDAPQTPLRSWAMDSEVVSTPTARTACGPCEGGADAWTLRTPSARTHASSALGGGARLDRARPSSTSHVSLGGEGLVPNSLPAAMETSLSLGSRGVETPGHAGRARARPDSMQSALSSTASSTALFGVTALTREERKKQHRRTFSSDWPTLQANLASQKRRSKIEPGRTEAMDV